MMNDSAVILLMVGGLGALAYFAARAVMPPVSGQSSDAGLDRAISLIKNWEGLRLKAYQDSGGVWTIGWGNTSVDGRAVAPGLTITQDKADQLLMNSVLAAQNTVNLYVKVPLNSNQRAALISFVYNVGPGNFASSTLLKKINARDFDGAADEFQRWVYDDKKQKVSGLIARRSQEKGVFLS